MNIMSKFVCSCGNNSGHTSSRQCAANVESTRVYMNSLNGFRPTQDAFREIHPAGNGQIKDADGRLLIVADNWPNVILVDSTIPFGLGGRTTVISSKELCGKIRTAARA
jgi:hypothetical protein